MVHYYFRNKDEIIVIVDFVPEANAFIKIEKWFSPDFALLTVKKAFDLKHLNALKKLNSWYQNRGIPQFRGELNQLLVKLNINDIFELKHNSYALSLSDQY